MAETCFSLLLPETDARTSCHKGPPPRLSIAAIGLGPYLRDFVTVTYHSFWGQLGWTGVSMPRLALWALFRYMVPNLG
jgi:hypothetical protein